MTISRNVYAAALMSVAFASMPLAAATTIREFVVPTDSFDLTAGADGAVWFTISDATALGRLSTDGTYRTVDLPAPSVPFEDLGLLGITLAPDGSLWAAAPLRNSVFRLSLAGVTSQFQTPNLSPSAVTTGPDGNVWFSAPHTVGRITNSGQITLFGVPNNLAVGHITAGPDGNLWLAEKNANKVARVTLTGDVTEFTLPHPGSSPLSITPGFNNDLWFTEADGNRIGHITTSGAITEYDLPHPSSQPVTIVKAPDGNLWFTEYAGRIGRITPQGVVTEITVPVPTVKPAALAVGPDGNLWFTETQGISIGRVTLGGTPGPCVPGDTVLCIDDTPGDRRFKVEVEYSTTQGGGLAGSAHAVPLASLDVNRGGLFWFFSQDNPELLVKVLDGCADNGHRWVFLSGGTNVGLIATVADTVTGEVHTYYNRDVTPFAPVQDTKAHACVP
ncbi:MAG TPA: hypothetical protein VH988_16510 [Thermoanaerobaculia bacterium]|jgi:virginiamycin B lyase|nr:hypothetical protein [Thermoanaerobaculia bacterium]